MSERNIAFFTTSAHSVNYGRQLLLADKLNHVVVKNFTDFSMNLKEANSFLIADDIDILSLIKLYIHSTQVRNKRISFKILFLELYTISLKSLLNEISWYLCYDSFSLKQALIQVYYTPKRLLRLIFFRLILRSNICTIILPSTLRIKYIKNLLNLNHDYKRVRNLLFNNSYSVKSNLNFNPYSYFYIAGNIYYMNDFEKVCKYALKSDVRVVVTSKQKLDARVTRKYSSVIVETGQLPHHEIIELTKNCLAGIAVFSNKNINQRYAASSKLYEFAAFGKPIIVSRVPGIEIEVKEFLIKNVFYIDQLDSIQLIDIPFIQTEFDSSFNYDNELKYL